MLVEIHLAKDGEINSGGGVAVKSAGRHALVVRAVSG